MYVANYMVLTIIFFLPILLVSVCCVTNHHDMHWCQAYYLLPTRPLVLLPLFLKICDHPLLGNMVERDGNINRLVLQT